MFRSRYPVLLTLALAGAGLAWGQDNSAAPKYQDRVGKIITVLEASRHGERCQIAQAWELADGNIAMLSRSLSTGLTVTVVEQVHSTAIDRFLVYRWTADGLPPSGCPMPAGASSIAVTKGYPAERAEPVATMSPRTVPPAAVPVAPRYTGSSVVQRTPPMVQEAPRPVVQASAPPAPASSAPVMSSPVVDAKPALKAEPPRFLADSKPIDAMPLPAAPKSPETASAPIQPASARAGTGSSSVVQAKPITTEMPKIVVQGQPATVQPERLPAPKSAPVQAAQAAPKIVTSTSNAGRLINVTEKGKAPEQCVVLESAVMPDGSETMKAQSLRTGEVMTIVCDCKHSKLSFFERFRLARCKGRDVCCEPCPVATEKPKAWGPAMTYEKKGEKPIGDPLLPKVEEKKAEKLPEITKETPKVVAKPKEEPKLPLVNPKDVVSKPAPLPPKVAAARPIEKAEKGVMVPVPLVPLIAAEDKPNVPPPQPVVRPFETLESKAVTTYVAEPKAPMAPPSAQAMRGSGVVQVANQAPASDTNSYSPRAPICDNAGPVGTTGWTSGPFRPVTEVPQAIQGVQRASYNQDPTSAQNTVYLLTVLQSSGTPTQREWAAKKLCVCDPRSAPYVVEALMTAAKGDSAPLVRVACIQTLVKMQAKNATVLGMLQQAKLDKDPRVADEALVALTVLGDAKPAVQQASGKVKK